MRGILTSHLGVHQTANLLLAILVHDLRVLDFSDRVGFLLGQSLIRNSKLTISSGLITPN